MGIRAVSRLALAASSLSVLASQAGAGDDEAARDAEEDKVIEPALRIGA